jgi:hypothetical protein
MRHLPPAELQRLAKILSRLGSNHDGEVLAAGRLAHDLARRLGATWDELLRATPRSLAAPPSSISAKLSLCRRRLSELTAWEQQFVLSLHHFRRLSEKQLRILDRLVAAIGEGRRVA